MKKLIVAICMLPGFVFGQSTTYQVGEDQIEQFGVTTGFTLTGFLLLDNFTDLKPLESAVVSMGTVMLFGILKELLVDDKWNSADVEASAYGVGFGGAVLPLMFKIKF